MLRSCYCRLTERTDVLRLAPALTLALVSTFALLALATPAAAQAPVLTEIYPADGDVLAEPPANLHLCFARPVDNADDADFRFRVTTPLGSTLGARIVFQPDGLGVDMQPGLPDEPIEGEWIFEWRVTDDETKEPTTGEIHYQVSADGEPPIEQFERCTGEEPPPAPSTPLAEDGDDGLSGWLLALIFAVPSVAVVCSAIVFLARRRGGNAPGSAPPSDS